MKNKITVFAFVILLGFIALQLPITSLLSVKVKFTIFDLIAPVFGTFLGTGFGILVVFSVQLINLFFNGASNLDKALIIRLIPTLFAVYYFAKSKNSSGKWILAIPLLAIVSFLFNETGRSVWFYSLFWLIPVLVWPFREKVLMLKSLGATFTAHAVGGAIWIWVFNLPTAFWISLIPLVVVERIIFALGISASYILLNNIIYLLNKNKLIKISLNVENKYILKFLK